MARFGKAAITWASTQQTNGVHLLETPLRSVRPALDREVFFAQSLDRSVIQTYTIAPGAQELLGNFRYDQHATNLMEMLRVGSDNNDLTYIPNLDDPDHHYIVKLMEPRSPAQIPLDAERGQKFGDHQIQVRFRVVSSSPSTSFDDIYHGTNTLFSYRAGEKLDRATFTRTSTGTFNHSYAGYGYGQGQWSTAVASANSSEDVARLHWERTSTRQLMRTLPTLLLESSATNIFGRSFRMDLWSALSNSSATSSQRDPFGGTDAWSIRGISTGTVGRVTSTTINLPTTGVHALSVFLKAGTTASTGAQVVFQPSTAPITPLIQMAIAWSSGIPTVTLAWGTSWRAPERWTNGWWRVTAVSTVGQATARNMELILQPNTLGPLQDLLVYGWQLE